MNQLSALTAAMLLSISVAHAQTGIGTTSTDPSALLELKSGSKGILVPRMAAANRLGITAPAEGLLVYDMDSAAFFYYALPGTWTKISTNPGLGNHSATQNIMLNDNWLSNDGDPEGIRIDATGNVGVGVAVPAEKLQVAGNVMIPGTSGYKYATAKTNYYTVSPAAFIQEGTTYSTAIGPYGVYIPNGSSTVVGYLDAPVNLPNGATVTKLEGFFYR